MTRTAAMDGLLNVHKPIGETSRDTVDRVAKPLRKVKVGHAGTLDPLASGVLVLCLGSATRLIEYVQRMTKVYRTTVCLDATSDTLDADGRIEPVAVEHIPGLDEIRTALAAQVGTIDQLPPQYSALKVGGKRAYGIARAGQTVALQPRPVRIDRIDVFRYEWPRVELEITCGSGTYIRSIARDLGLALGCGGLLEVLTRTRIGPFRLEDAVTVDRLTPEAIPSLLLPSVEALGEMPRVHIGPEDVGRVRRGQAIGLVGVDGGEAVDSEIALLDDVGRLIALGRRRPDGHILPVKVLGSE